MGVAGVELARWRMGSILFSAWCHRWRTAARSPWRVGVLLGLVLATLGAAAGAEEDVGRQPGLAVIYPDIGEPYRSVFATILGGIEERTPGKVAAFPIAMGGNPPSLSDELKRRDIHAVIALGRSGLKVAANLDRQIKVVAAGVLSVAEADSQGMQVQSLAPDPALLFAKLKALVPSARRVIVVYDPRQNEWLIRLAGSGQGMLT